MSLEPPGSLGRPLRVAIVGAGPAGFYAAEALLRPKDLAVEVDLLERLPVPFGLLRAGVAPDHQQIKRASAAFERTAADPRLRFLGNLELGRELTVADLLELYDQVIVCTGSASDRRLGIPGEELGGSHPATAFVGWYNAHPDFAEERFDLSAPRAVVVGAGNVAIDVVRILVSEPERLGPTDIAGYALEALRASEVREVVLLVRRGPAEAAFDERELRAVAELADVEVIVRSPEFPTALDVYDHATQRKLRYLSELAAAPPKPGARRRVTVQFLASPVELHAGADGRVARVSVEENRLAVSENGTSRAVGTGARHDLEAGLVLRSIGYLGVPIAGLPFDGRAGIIPNRDGRVTDGAGGPVVPRVYVAGWIKRGPTGVIGTNKADAAATVAVMLEDAKQLGPEPERSRAAVDARLAERGVRVATLIDWRAIDELEREVGRDLGKVREKLSSIQEMMRHADRARGSSG
ncbi:MAG: FAD-dependent oxidoreductase [Sorangiineae bacterium]|nr:FAD-dependent oxidoreductase [Polyangiaceae bacterium]MEB2321562.1 FAD-dependent oxidoreductase [Sorangiineae bacterium]